MSVRCPFRGKDSRTWLNVRADDVGSDHRAEIRNEEKVCLKLSSTQLLEVTIDSATQLNAARKSRDVAAHRAFSLRKEVIQPQVLLRLPCYDFTPIMNYTLGGCSLAVSAPTSSATHFRDVTGGVYKARERIHRGMLIRDY